MKDIQFGGTNDYGFSALGGGFLEYNYYGLIPAFFRSDGYWWSSKANSDGRNGYNLEGHTNNLYMMKFDYDALSVRCIKTGESPGYSDVSTGSVLNLTYNSEQLNRTVI